MYLRLARRMVWFYMLSEPGTPLHLKEKAARMVRADISKIKVLDWDLLGVFIRKLYPQYSLPCGSKDCRLLHGCVDCNIQQPGKPQKTALGAEN
jgi:hypothetical protein